MKICSTCYLYFLEGCMLRKMKAKPIVFNWVSTNKDQEVTRCSLPWEVSLYRSLQQKLDKPCETLDQYKAKVVGMEAYIYQFLNPISSEYLSCPGTIHIYLFFQQVGIFLFCTMI